MKEFVITLHTNDTVTQEKIQKAIDSLNTTDIIYTITDNTNATTKTEMRELKKGEKFTINGITHTASVDSHYSSDATYDGYIVYDEDDESYFEEDFPD